MAKYKDSRKCLVLLGAILEAPELVERLTEVLTPNLGEPPQRSGRRKKLAGASRMTWAMFYLVCFLIGVTLSVVSFLSGSFHLPQVHVHVPHIGGHVAGGAQAAGTGAEMPFLNFGTIAAFLAWFGGTGYLLTRYSSWFSWVY